MSCEILLLEIKARLGKKTIYELRQISRAVNVVPSGDKKAELIEAILNIASAKVLPAPRSSRGAPPRSLDCDKELVDDIIRCRDGYIALKNGTGIVSESIELTVSDGTEEDVSCTGVLWRGEKYYFLRVTGCFPSPDDVLVHESYINRFNLRLGDVVSGMCRRRSEEEAPGLIAISSVNGVNPHAFERADFEDLIPVYPDKRLVLGINSEHISARMADIFAPVGLGQRAAIIAPSNCGKTELVNQIVSAVSAYERKLQLVYLTIAGRPEDVTYLRRTFSNTELFCSTFDMPDERHVEAAAFTAEYCKRMVEGGKDVVLIVSGIANLEYACRAQGKAGGAKRLLACAKNTEGGGSLTIIFTLGGLNDTIYTELAETANMHLVLSEELAQAGVFPAIDIKKSYTEHCGLLQSAEEELIAQKLKQILAKNGDSSKIVRIFKEFPDNSEIIERYK